MSNVGVMLTSVLGGGSGMVAVTAARWLGDARARRRAERAAAERAPLQQRSYELRIAAQADEVLQDTISTLRESLREVRKELAEYKRDTDNQRRRDLEEHQRQRKLDLEELDRARAEIEELNQKISDQDATIAALKFQLQRAGSGP